MSEPPDTGQPRNSKPGYQKYLRYSTVGLELGFSVIIGLLIGQWLDSKLGTEPWLLLLFLIFGLVAGFRSLFRLMKDSLRDDHDRSGPSGKYDDTP